MLIEKQVHTEKYAGTVDLICGIDDFDVNIEFDKDLHAYFYNGKCLKSVTTMLDKGEMAHIDEEILQKAALRGTIIHEDIEEYLKTGEIGFTDELQSFIDIYESNKELFDTKCIIDHKSGGFYKDKVYAQMRMYSNAIKFLTGEEINDFYVTHLPNGKQHTLKKVWKDGNKIRSKTIYKCKGGTVNE